MNHLFNKLSLIASSASLLAFACSPASPQLMPPPKAFSALSGEAIYSKATRPNPRLTVLFVEDDSVSMDKNILNLASNGKGFSEAFSKYKNLIVHAGVVSVSDSKLERTLGTRPAHCLPVGKLHPLKDPNCPSLVVPGPSASFVTQETGTQKTCAASHSDPSAAFASILSATLNLPIERAYEVSKDANGVNVRKPLCGSEDEEVFSPIMAAFSEQVNPGFFQPGGYVAVVVLTDLHGGADSSEFTPSQVAAHLATLTNGRTDMVATFAALSLSKGCASDDSGEAGKIPALLRMTGNHAPYDICSTDFGHRLAIDVAKFVDRVVAEANFSLPVNGEPDISTLRVFLGERQLKAGEWYYESHRVVVDQKILDAAPNGAKIRFQATAISG